MDFKASKSIDCCGQLCPVPILMTEEVWSGLGTGAVLEVLFTDPGAEPDLRAWCRARGEEWLGARRHGTVHHAWLRRLTQKGK
ncbi:MAG: Sulfur carrier protein TusA [Candidatus Omnitrophica bacterium]|nr:Sulfur carrier protein TusA [Candidatus Omnitrophota bacterium]